MKNAKTETALEKVARLRAELIEAETSLDRMTAEARTRAVREEEPRIRAVTKADVPPGILRVVTRPFHGPGVMVYDGGAVLDLNAISNGAAGAVRIPPPGDP